jgi:DivIVA domain-containing protein
MTWVLAILIVLALGGVAVVAAGRGTPMAEAYDDRPDALVPADRPLVGADLRRVRFSLALRGYRMSEVDALLDRLAAQLEGAVGDSLGPGSEPDEPSDESRGEPRDGGVTGEARGDRRDG